MITYHIVFNTALLKDNFSSVWRINPVIINLLQRGKNQIITSAFIYNKSTFGTCNTPWLA